MKHLLQTILLISVILSGLPSVAFADIITTESALATQQHDASMERVNGFLMRADVKSQLVRMGVDPIQALKRVDALTLQELTVLEEHINDLPAGGAGVVGVIGIVAIVLIILELLGVTNVFTRF